MTTIDTILQQARLSPTTITQLTDDDLNQVYRVTTAAETLVVRVPGAAADPAQPLLTIAWLQHLARCGLERIPRYVDRVPLGNSFATILTWVAGEPLEKRVTPADARAMGVFTARLHNASDSFSPPETTGHLRWDWDRLFGPGTILHAPERDYLLTPQQQNILQQTAQRVRVAMDRLEGLPQTYGAIHSDLHTSNVVMEHGVLGAIDFGECAPGWYLFDAAVPLLDFALDWDEPRDDLHTAWLEGYQSVRLLLPEIWAELPVFLAARCAETTNWVLDWSEETQAESAAEFLAESIDWLAEWLDQDGAS